MNFENLIKEKQLNPNSKTKIQDSELSFNNNIDNYNNIDNIDDKTELDNIQLKGINNSDNQTLTDLDLNTKRVKLYLNLLDENHHYFINYNNCYNDGQLILDLLEKNKSQEIKNTIKLKLTKYKKNKNIKYENNVNSIDIIDSTNNKKIETIIIPYCIHLKEILDKYENKLSTLYINCRLKYNSLIKDINSNESELIEFRKLRSKLSNKINEFYTLQYVYNNIKKKRNTDNHYILHNTRETYISSKGDIKYLLQLTNSSINSKSLEYLLDTEVEILNYYNDILLDINKNNKDKNNIDTIQKIKDYITLQNNLGKNIKKLQDIKNSIKTDIIYFNDNDINSINNSIITNYINSLTKKSIVKNNLLISQDNNTNNDNLT